MILIADSGSTKTDWRIIDKNEVIAQQQTSGINPVHQTKEAIKDILSMLLEPHRILPAKKETEVRLSQIHFYGAGCSGSYIRLMSEVLAGTFQISLEQVHVYSDMLGAARAVCGRDAGIACILGTGANSCYYDGKDIVDNIPPLGYILGDEGSGAVLGKHFLNALFKRELPEELCQLFLTECGLTYADIIERVYRQPMANRFLATTSVFIGKHLADYHELNQLVIDNFRAFFRKNVSKYQHSELPVGAVGSIAHHYQSQLRAAAALEGFRMGNIIKSPIDGLIAYHNNTKG